MTAFYRQRDHRLLRKARFRSPDRPASTAAPRCGVSLLEVIVVLTVIGVLISMSVPSFHRSIEQSHADLAGATLRSIWSAQRLVWLENRAYASDLSELQSLDLVDPTTVNGTTRYDFAISAADAGSFTATATRVGSDLWSGQLTIDEQGVQAGAIQASGHTDIIPGFQ